jgi:hypothetical protein
LNHDVVVDSCTATGVGEEQHDGQRMGGEDCRYEWSMPGAGGTSVGTTCGRGGVGWACSRGGILDRRMRCLASLPLRRPPPEVEAKEVLGGETNTGGEEGGSSATGQGLRGLMQPEQVHALHG